MRAIWRIALSTPLSWMLTYVNVRSASRQGRFRALRALVRVFLLYPGQTGTGQKCPMRDTFCPSLDICAPKPHRRQGPRLYPVPSTPIRRRNKYSISHAHLFGAYVRGRVPLLYFTRLPCQGTKPNITPVTFSAQGGVVRWCASAKRRGCRTSLLSKCGAPGRPQTRARRVSPCRGSVRRPCRASAVFPPDRR